MGAALLPQDVHEPRIQGHARHRDQRTPGIHLAIRNAVATLQKPFDPEELLSIVNRVLESKDAARKAMDGE